MQPSRCGVNPKPKISCRNPKPPTQNAMFYKDKYWRTLPNFDIISLQSQECKSIVHNWRSLSWGSSCEWTAKESAAKPYTKSGRSTRKKMKWQKHHHTPTIQILNPSSYKEAKVTLPICMEIVARRSPRWCWRAWTIAARILTTMLKH